MGVGWLWLERCDVVAALESPMDGVVSGDVQGSTEMACAAQGGLRQLSAHIRVALRHRVLWPAAYRSGLTQPAGVVRRTQSCVSLSFGARTV